MQRESLTRRQALKTGLGLLVGAALPHATRGQAAARVTGRQPDRPNVIYIMADQLRACSVGCYGNDEISTPHIDGLAAEGARLSAAVSTSPLCTPHRGCLMTGRYPLQTGVALNNQKLPTAEITIAELYRQAGYRTGYIGKWHLDGYTHDPPEEPGWVAPEDRQGFSMWIGYNCGHDYYDSFYYENRDPVVRQIPAGEYEPDWQTGRAIDWISHVAGRPFFLVLSIGTPHPPGGGEDLPPCGDYQFPYAPGDLTLRPNVDFPDPDLVRQEYADYYGITSNLDWNVGRIVSALADLDLADNTIVVVSSDHGDYLGSHFAGTGRLRGKAVIYAEALDVPFLLRWPGHVEPQVISEAITSVDIMPTLLGLCGLPVPGGVMGRDFAPVLAGSGPPIEPPWGPVPSSSAFVGIFPPAAWIGVRSSEYTLACEGRERVPAELYHNTADPYQLVNLVDDPGYAPVRDALRDECLAWLDYVEQSPG